MEQQYIFECVFPCQGRVFFKDSLSVSNFLKSKAPESGVYEGIGMVDIEQNTSCAKSYRLWKKNTAMFVNIKKHPIYVIPL